MNIAADISGWIGLMLSVTVLFPQILKTVRTKDVSGVSRTMYLQLSVACILLIVKAALTGAYFFILTYGATFMASMVMLFLIRKLK